MTKPTKLQAGDTVAVIAPSQSLASINGETRAIAKQRFKELGLKVIFGEHVEEVDDFGTSSIESRIADLHAALANADVKAIFAVRGGWSANQLLRYIDWALVKNNPKIFCGFSNITMFCNAIYTKTGIVTYYGPGYSSFGQLKHFDYTLEYVKKCLMSDEPFTIEASESWSDDNWKADQENRNLIPNDGLKVLNEGVAEGAIVGGCLCDFNLLQGTEYMPSLDGTILFLEDDVAASPQVLDRELQSLILQPDFSGVRGIVFGRFQKQSNISPKVLEQIIKGKKELGSIPIIANADFGHTEPRFTFPIGGTGKLIAEANKVSVHILDH